jgi:hypothetical protein
MAEDIKKTYVFNDQLTKVDKNNNHHLRFRITTDDLSRVSSWTPFYELPATNITAVTGTAVGLSTSILFAWEDTNARPEYDIFIATSTNNGSTYSAYEYHGTSPIHTYSIIKAAGVNRVKFIIQVASYEQTLSSAIEAYPRLTPRTYTESFAIV